MSRVPARVLRFAGEQWLRGHATPVYPELPAARPSPQMLAQVALDEAILAVMKGPDRYPSDEDARRVAASVRTAFALHTARGWVDDPLSYHRRPPPLTAPDRVEDRRSLGTAYEHLSWSSGYEPWPDEPGRDRWLARTANRTAHAYVLRHAQADRPWVVCLHGLCTGLPQADFAGFRVNQLHTELGLNVMMPVLPLHGPRGAGRIRGMDFLTYDLVAPLLGLTQAVWDVRRAISWIRAQGGEQVAVHGISLGGKVAALLAQHEPDLDLVVAGVPLVDIPGMFASHSPRAQRRRAMRSELLGETTYRVHGVVSPLAAPPLLPRDRLALYAGLGDRMTTPQQAHRLWTHWDHPEVLWFPGSHIGFMWSAQVRGFLHGLLRDRGLLPDLAAQTDGTTHSAARVESLLARRKNRTASASIPLVR